MSAPTGIAEIWIDAPTATVWQLVSDIGNLARYSPETVRTEWTNGSTRAVAGATFRGFNDDGTNQWHADCVITELVAGEVFAFGVAPDDHGRFATTWRYTIRADGTGTYLTESFEAPILLNAASPPAQNPNRAKEMVGMLHATLAYIKADAEAGGRRR